MVAIDLDEAEEGTPFGPIFSSRPWRPYRYDRSHLHQPENPSLKDAVINTVTEKSSLEKEDIARVLVVTQPKTFGHCFNPVSFYYVYDSSGRLRAVMSEINNTPWNQRHSYVMEMIEGEPTHEFEKDFHVSPFMPMEQKYRWTFKTPNEDLVVQMENHDPQEGHLFDAGMKMKREELSSLNLIKTLLLFPLNTLKTLTAIYWHALWLRMKGATYHSPPQKVSHA